MVSPLTILKQNIAQKQHYGYGVTLTFGIKSCSEHNNVLCKTIDEDALAL